jgi:3-hydroxybutyryl-CoA dehydrogenase
MSGSTKLSPGKHPMSLHLAIIGAGKAGRSFAASCADAGHSVTLEDVMPAKLRHAGDHFAELGHTVRLVSTVEDAVHNADIAIDFVPDELESKLEIFSLLDRMAPPRTILLTPSDVLSITDLASCTYRPDRCLMFRGLHPTRLLHTLQTSPEALAACKAFIVSLGQTPSSEPDPDLPQLVKNMNLPVGSQL